MSSQNNSEEFYAKLKDKLEESTSWPSQYLYKFIIPSDKKKVSQIDTIFDNTGAVIKTKKSSNGKYTSVSIFVNMKDTDAVIEKYIEVGKIDGVISL